MQRIAQRLYDWDVVTLQEMWIESDRQLVIESAASIGLVHHHYFRSNNFGGSGLLVLSRYAVIETDFFYYRLCGKPQRLHHGTPNNSTQPISSRFDSIRFDWIRLVYNTESLLSARRCAIW
jgi:hypothetical protein